MKLTDESLMPFGKHKGEKMEDVPATYLDWFRGACKIKNAYGNDRDVLDYIDRNRDVIDKELEENT